jgi:hypothetical protein
VNTTLFFQPVKSTVEARLPSNLWEQEGGEEGEEEGEEESDEEEGEGAGGPLG